MEGSVKDYLACTFVVANVGVSIILGSWGKYLIAAAMICLIFVGFLVAGFLKERRLTVRILLGSLDKLGEAILFLLIFVVIGSYIGNTLK